MRHDERQRKPGRRQRREAHSRNSDGSGWSLKGWRAWAVAALAVLGIAGAVSAQQRGPITGYERGGSSGWSNRPRVITQPGQFDYYLLALSWSPTHCANLSDASSDPQCNSRSGRRYGFVMHGLWPQFERGFPEYCPTDDRGFVPRPVAQRMLDIMPSERLVFHQYRKHGVCSGLGVDGYFALSRAIFNKVNIPTQFRDVTDAGLTVPTEGLIKQFLYANPGLKREHIVVQCESPGPRLKEVRICFNKQGEFRPCGPGIDQRRMCGAPRMTIPPMRPIESTPPPGRVSPGDPNYGRRI